MNHKGILSKPSLIGSETFFFVPLYKAASSFYLCENLEIAGSAVLVGFFILKIEGSEEQASKILEITGSAVQVSFKILEITGSAVQVSCFFLEIAGSAVLVGCFFL